MRWFALIPVVLMVCGCIFSDVQETTSTTSTTLAFGDGCQGLAGKVNQDNCYLNLAYGYANASFCQKIRNTPLRDSCTKSVGVTSTLIKSTTTQTPTTAAPVAITTSSSQTSTTQTTTPQQNPSGSAVVECTRKLGFDPDSAYYAYRRGCGSNYVSDASIASRQAGIDVIQLNVQASSNDTYIKVLECFYGAYSDDNKEFKFCPRILCPRTGEYQTLGGSVSSSVQSQLIGFLERCRASSNTREATLEKELATTTTTTLPPKASTLAPSSECNSTNPSRDYYVKGVTIGKNGQKTDLCVVSEKYPSHDRVRKYYCTPDGYVALVEYTCPLQCMDGACINQKIAGIGD
jgi:hypothetical protein